MPGNGPDNPLKKGWSKLAPVLFDLGLPSLGGALAGPAGAAIGKKVADALGRKNDPDAVAEAIAVDPELAVKLQELENEQARIVAEKEQFLADQDSRRIDAVNATMQAELAAMIANPKAGSWRPLWGILGAWVWLGSVVLSFASLGVVIYRIPEHSIVLVPVIIAFLGGLFTGMYAVLGISAYKRGQEKIEIAEGLKHIVEQAVKKPTVRAEPVRPSERIEGTIFRRD